jgi:uncharacterized membrane protein
MQQRDNRRDRRTKIKGGFTVSNLIVIAFDNTEEAEQVRDSLRGQSKYGTVSVDDTAVVVKDADGKVHVDNQVSKGTWGGTGLGALVGILLGGIFMPVGGLLLGAGGGALIARLMHLGVDGDFVKEVGEQIQPGTSALFILGKGDPNAVLGVLREHHGKVLQTTLSEEAEENLKQALGDKE